MFKMANQDVLLQDGPTPHASAPLKILFPSFFKEKVKILVCSHYLNRYISMENQFFKKFEKNSTNHHKNPTSLELLHLENKRDGCVGKPKNWFCALSLDLDFALPGLCFQEPQNDTTRTQQLIKTHSEESLLGNTCDPIKSKRHWENKTAPTASSQTSCSYLLTTPETPASAGHLP